MRVNKEKSQITMAKMIIGESTPIRIGLILAFLSMFGSSVWWASSVNSKLDTILAFQSSTSIQITELKAADIAITKDLAEVHVQNSIFDLKIKDLETESSKRKNYNNP